MDESAFETAKGYPDSITVSRSTLRLNADATAQLTATVIGGSGEYDDVEWVSATPYVAAVDQSGLVTPSHAGSTVITARTVYGRRTAACSVTVDPIGTVTSISIDPTLSLDLNSEFGPLTGTLTAVIAPENAANKAVSWYSGNTSVATVSSAGVVTAKAVGTATIRATSVSNSQCTAYCEVSVSCTPSSYKRLNDVAINRVVFAEYSRALDRIVVISDTSDRLSLIDPANGSVSVAALPHPPLSIGLSLDGLKAAIGYDCYVGVVDLNGGAPFVESTWPITAYPGIGKNNGRMTSVALDPLGYIYGVDDTDQWISLRQIDTSSGAEVLKSNSVRAYSVCRIHESGTSMYISERDSTTMKHVDISIPGASSLPYYNKSSSSSYQFWYYDDGNALITSTAYVRSITHVSSTDLALVGNIRTAVGGNSIAWADHHSLALYGGSTGLIAAVSASTNPSPLNMTVCLADHSTFELKNRYYLPKIPNGGASDLAYGRYCFWNSSGTELYVLIQSASDPAAWRLVVY